VPTPGLHSADLTEHAMGNQASENLTPIQIIKIDVGFLSTHAR
jgi:hypothetical protein